MKGESTMMIYVWLGVIIVASIVEMATTQLVSIWFALGGAGALIACLLGGSIPLQITAFIIVTLLTLILIRPFSKRALSVKKTSTNADRYVGKTAIVTKEIDNARGTGRVTVLENSWMARSADGSVIPAGKLVFVESIEGVKLIVHLKNN